MESVIKWQTGEIKEVGEYIVTLLDGTVSLDYYARPCYDGKLKPTNYTKDSIIAWCPLTEIESYKNRSMDNKTNQVTNKELQELLKQYPDDAVIAIEYCNIRELKYIKDRNLIVID